MIVHIVVVVIYIIQRCSTRFIWSVIELGVKLLCWVFQVLSRGCIEILKKESVEVVIDMILFMIYFDINLIRGPDGGIGSWVTRKSEGIYTKFTNIV